MPTTRHSRVPNTPRPSAACVSFPHQVCPPNTSQGTARAPSPTPPSPLSEPITRWPASRRHHPTTEISIRLQTNWSRTRVGPTGLLRRLRVAKTLNSLLRLPRRVVTGRFAISARSTPRKQRHASSWPNSRQISSTDVLLRGGPDRIRSPSVDRGAWPRLHRGGPVADPKEAW